MTKELHKAIMKMARSIFTEYTENFYLENSQIIAIKVAFECLRSKLFILRRFVIAIPDNLRPLFLNTTLP